MNSLHYLETSGLNVLADNLSDFDFNKFAQDLMKFDWCISAVVLWEVFLNSSDSRRDYLIYWAQFNCANYLLKSPTELIVSYLRQETPDSDRKLFWYNRESDLELAKVWVRIHRKLDRTIPIDLDELKERSAPLRQISRIYSGVIESMTDKSSDGYDEEYFHKKMIDLANLLEAADYHDRRDEKLIKTSLILVFFFLCIGVELDNSPIREHWKPSKIDDPFERLEFLIENSPKIFVKGPIIEMAIMMEAQAESSGSTNRGSIFDSLHTVYCYYADNVISEDGHFHKSPDSRDSGIFSRVVPASEYLKVMHAGKEKAEEIFGAKSD